MDPLTVGLILGLAGWATAGIYGKDKAASEGRPVSFVEAANATTKQVLGRPFAGTIASAKQSAIQARQDRAERKAADRQARAADRRRRKEGARQGWLPLGKPHTGPMPQFTARRPGGHEETLHDAPSWIQQAWRKVFGNPEGPIIRVDRTPQDEAPQPAQPTPQPTAGGPTGQPQEPQPAERAADPRPATPDPADPAAEDTQPVPRIVFPPPPQPLPDPQPVPEADPAPAATTERTPPVQTSAFTSWDQLNAAHARAAEAHAQLKQDITDPVQLAERDRQFDQEWETARTQIREYLHARFLAQVSPSVRPEVHAGFVQDNPHVTADPVEFLRSWGLATETETTPAGENPAGEAAQEPGGQTEGQQQEEEGAESAPAPPTAPLDLLVSVADLAGAPIGAMTIPQLFTLMTSMGESLNLLGGVLGQIGQRLDEEAMFDQRVTEPLATARSLGNAGRGAMTTATATARALYLVWLEATQTGGRVPAQSVLNAS